MIVRLSPRSSVDSEDMDTAGSGKGCGQFKGPKVRVCYVCGRSYGLSSYEIHLKQCKALWEAQQQALPLAERKPVPKEPEVGNLVGSGQGLDAQNEAAMRTFNEEALEACEHCGRTFLADRLKIHQKSCTSSSPAKPVGATRLATTTAAGPSVPPSPATTSRPKTSKLNKTPKGVVNQPRPSSGSGSSTQGEGSFASLAGNYGGIARRGSRGVQASDSPRSSSTSSTGQDPLAGVAVAAMEKRLASVEEELIDTRRQMRDILQVVANLQSKVT